MNPVHVDQISRQCTEAWQTLLKWYYKQIAPAGTGVEQIDKTLDSVGVNIEKVTRNLLYYTIPRFLYDFFDLAGVKIYITEPVAGQWVYSVADWTPPGNRTPSVYEGRPAAEEAAFIKAFEILEGRLKIKFSEDGRSSIDKVVQG